MTMTDYKYINKKAICAATRQVSKVLLHFIPLFLKNESWREKMAKMLEKLRSIRLSKAYC